MFLLVYIFRLTILDEDFQIKTHLGLRQFKLSQDKSFNITWDLKEIREIQLRRYVYRYTANEIFFIDGTSIFLNFPDGGVEDIPYKLARLKKTKCPKDFFCHATIGKGMFAKVILVEKIDTGLLFLDPNII